jgi:hypothetical protein
MWKETAIVRLQALINHLGGGGAEENYGNIKITGKGNPFSNLKI